MAIITVEGTGSESAYRIDFSGAVSDFSDLEIGDQVGRDPSVAIGSVVDGADTWKGPLPATVKNTSPRLIGTAPDIIVRFGGRGFRLSEDETITLEAGGNGGNGNGNGGGGDGNGTGRGLGLLLLLGLAASEAS